MKIANHKKTSFLVLLLLSTSFCYLSFVSIPVLHADGENWLNGWNYRKSHNLTGNSGAGTNYQINITVLCGSGSDSGNVVYLNGSCQTDFDDIRFTDDDGITELAYYLEDKTDGDFAKFWVKVNDDLDSNQVVYVYYGNDEVASDSNGENTFILFDDFEDDSLDSDKWETMSSGNGSITESGGKLSIAGIETYANFTVCQNVENYPDFDFPYDISIRVRSTLDAEGSGNRPFQRIGICNWTSYGSGAKTDNYIFAPYQQGDYHETFTWKDDGIITYVEDSSWDGAAEVWYDISYDDTDGTTILYDGTECAKSPIDVDDALYPDDEDESMVLSFQIFHQSTLWIHEVFIRKWVHGDISHGSWGEEEYARNNVPINSGFAFLDMDDTDNLYAQKQYYTAQYIVSDYDGYADIDYAEFSIMQSSTVRATFRFDEDTSTFSIEEGSSNWDLDVGSCSYECSGETITLNFTISPKFNALEESDVDILAFVVDDEPENSTDTIQTDYADVVTDLVVSGFACDDDRGNVGQSLNFSGSVFYANDPSSGTASSFYPPDNEFTAIHVYDSRDISQGSDSSITNGAFSVSFSALSSVDLEAYNPYIDMADAEYADAEENPTVAFISDRIRIVTLGAGDTRVNVDDAVEIYATAELEYDGHSLGSGDGLTIESLDLIWNTTHFVGADSKPSVQQKVYDEGEGEETTYGVTALNLDSMSVSVIWDRLNVTFTVDDDLVPLNTETEFKVTIFREYDNSSVSSYSYNINRDDSAFIIDHTTEAFSDVSSSEGTRTYDFTNVTDNTYGLTAFTDPNDLFVAWYEGERFIVSRFSYNSSNPDASENIFFNGSLSDSSSPITYYEWDFGDGTSDSGETVIHSYNAKGTYLVTLNVTSEVGSDVYSTYITIGQSDQLTLIMAVALIVIVIAAGIGLLIYRRKRK